MVGLPEFDKTITLPTEKSFRMTQAKEGSLDRFARSLDWNLLFTFMVVVQEQGMTAAAERLLLTQPAISLALKRLETAIQVKLLERSPGKFRTTPAGDALYLEACKIYASVARLPIAFAEAPKDISGKITIATISQVISDEFNDQLSDFFNEHPKTELSIKVMTTTEVIRAVELGQVSLGVSDGVIPEPLEKLPLRTEEYAIFCGKSHPLFGKKNLKLKNLRGYAFVNFIADELGGQHMGEVTAVLAKASIGQHVRGQSSSVHEIRRMIEIGLGIGFLPFHLAEPYVQNGRLFRLPPYTEAPASHVFLIKNPATNFSAAERLFTDHMFPLVPDPQLL
jgi:DNA-binding transcriptional LysR family regulator